MVLVAAALTGVAAPVALGALGTLSVPGAGASVVQVPHVPAAGPSPTTASWCSAHGAVLAGWAATAPQLPLCGPGPDYGGTWSYVVLPGPGGTTAGAYFNATPGFQCVELAERFLAVADGLAPVKAEGSTLAASYHAAYPGTTLVVDGSPQAVGSPPVPGDVVSFSQVPSFEDPTDGHVAVVVASSVDRRTGDGTVVIAQENVAPSEMVRTIDLLDWRLEDPTEPGNAEWQYHYAEWLHVTVRHVDLLAHLRRGAVRARRAAPLVAPGIWPALRFEPQGSGARARSFGP